MQLIFDEDVEIDFTLYLSKCFIEGVDLLFTDSPNHLNPRVINKNILPVNLSVHLLKEMVELSYVMNLNEGDLIEIPKKNYVSIGSDQISLTHGVLGVTGTKRVVKLDIKKRWDD